MNSDCKSVCDSASAVDEEPREFQFNDVDTAPISLSMDSLIPCNNMTLFNDSNFFGLVVVFNPLTRSLRFSAISFSFSSTIWDGLKVIDPA